MAYETSNPPSLISQRIGGSGAEWAYTDGDSLDDVLEVNYITNATVLGMKAGDKVYHRDSTDLVTTDLVVNAHRTSGTASGALCSAIEPTTETSIALQSTGAGTFLIGDIVKFDNDPVTEYLLTTGDSDISGGGTLVITPGLVVATAVGTKITIKTDVLNLSSGKTGLNVEASLASTQLLTPSESGSIFLFDRAGGLTYTLPEAVIGLKYGFRTTVTLTSGVYAVLTSTATAGDFLLGTIMVADDAVAAEADTYFANGTSHLGVSSNKTTTGGLVGGWIDVECISASIWALKGHLQASGGATVINPLTT